MPDPQPVQLGAYRADLKFHELLDWHLIRGTRPEGSADPLMIGTRWENKDFAGAVGSAASDGHSVANWRKGDNLPINVTLTRIENALFGVNSAFAVWRADLRKAHVLAQREARTARLIARNKPPSIQQGSPEPSQRHSHNAFDDPVADRRVNGAAIRPEEIDAHGDPQSYLGSASQFIPVSWGNITDDVKLFHAAAMQGLASAQKNFGWALANGVGVDRDDAEAVKWFRLAAVQGDAEGQDNLGYMLREGRGVVKKELIESVVWFRKAAEQGLASAQNNLGWALANEVGVDRDDVEAVKWFQLAAEQGDAEGQDNLGYMLREGRGVVKKELTESVVWFRKAAEQGLASAQNNLGWALANEVGVDRDDVEAVKWFQLAAEQGHAEGQNNLGYMRRQRRGFLPDDREAFGRFLKAAEQGHASAQTKVGLWYETGRGVSPDNSKAVEWYRRAAEQGDAQGQHNLGNMYQYGRGVPPDNNEAFMWFLKAAEQGHASAQTNVGFLYETGRGVPSDNGKAVEWYRRAAEQGDAQGQHNLGNMYQYGRGVPPDDHEAFIWFLKAAEQGHASAQTNVGFLYETGRGVPSDNGKAVEWYRRAAEQGDAQGQYNLGNMLDRFSTLATSARNQPSIEDSNEVTGRLLSEWRQIASWVGIIGRWALDADGNATYLEPGPESFVVDPPIGFCVSDSTFVEGEIRATITLRNKTNGRIVLGYRSPDHEYFIVGLGGYGREYSFAHYIPQKKQWPPLYTSLRQEDQLAIGTPYHLHVEVRGKRITLKSKGAPIFEHMLSEPIPLGYVGLQAWGDTGNVEFTDVALRKTEPVPDRAEGAARITSKRDERGNVIENAFFGVDGNPVLSKTDGAARVTWKHDAHGKVIEKAYFGVDGQPVVNKTGFAARYTWKYDERGMVIDSAAFDVDGNPVSGW